MSVKTKAKLLAENAFLQDVIDALHGKVEHLTDEVKRLERTREIKDGIIHFLLDDSDRTERDSKIEKAAHGGTITKHIDTHNELGRVVEKQGKCRSERERRAKEKSDYCKQQYARFLADDIPAVKARTKANKATAEKFGKGLGRAALYKHCPAPSTDK